MTGRNDTVRLIGRGGRRLEIFADRGLDTAFNQHCGLVSRRAGLRGQISRKITHRLRAVGVLPAALGYLEP
jgi:hypothetical protein